MGHAYGHDHHKPDGYFSTLVSGPATPLVALADAKAFLRVTSSAEDDIVTALVQAATDYMDAESGILGRALITQRWQLTLPYFPARGHVDLPVPKVQQVTGITYYDEDNAQQTLSTDVYRLTVNGEIACIDLEEGESWPATYARADAVAIQYDAGYGDDPADVPQAIRTAALMMVAQWYDNRMASADKVYSEMPFGARALLMNYRLTKGHI